MHISINGVDTVGKSTQIMLLPLLCPGNRIVIAPPLKQYIPEFLMSARALFHWWMESSVEEFIERIAEGVARRESTVMGQFVIMDRGAEMFKAVCAAKWMLQQNHPSLPEMFEEIAKRFTSAGIREESGAHILLVKDGQYDRRTSKLRSICSYTRSEASDFTNEENLRYALYQECLKESVAHMAHVTGMPQIIVDDAIVETQNKLRKVINQQLGAQSEPLPTLGENIKTIVGLSGLSESGKSTRAEALVRQNSGYRLKLRFFNLLPIEGVVSEEESMAIKLLLFAHVHYYRNYFTVESIHGIKLAAYLKLFFGNRFELEYLDTPYVERVRRWATNNCTSFVDASSHIDKRDRLKEKNGCSSILSIADTVISW